MTKLNSNLRINMGGAMNSALVKEAMKVEVNQNDLDFYLRAVEEGMLSYDAASREIGRLTLERQGIIAKKKAIAQELEAEKAIEAEKIATAKAEQVKAKKAAAEREAIKDKRAANYKTQQKQYHTNKEVKRMKVKKKNDLFEVDAKSREHQHLLKVEVLESGFSTQVIRVQESAHLRSQHLETVDKTVTTGGYTREYSNFNNDVVILNLKDLAESDYIKYFSNELWISNDLTQMVVVNPETDSYIDRDKSEIIEDFNPNSDEYIRIKPSFMSPSQEKKLEVTCLRWDGNVEKYESVMDSMTNSAYSLFKLNSLDYGQLVKAGSRLAQGLSPSANIESYSLDSTAILLSKSKREFADGGGYFKSKSGYPVGLGAQLRNFATDKWFGLCVDEELMLNLTQHHGEVIYVEKEIAEGRITRDQAQKNIEAAFGWDERGPWAEKVVVLGIESGSPDLFVDLNIVKAPMDFMNLLPTSLKVLDLAGPTQGNTVVFGSQMLFSMLLTDSGKDLMNELLLETVADSIAGGSTEVREHSKELCEALKLRHEGDNSKDNTVRVNTLAKSIANEYYSKAPRVPSFEEFEESIDYSAGLIDTINPFWARTMDQGTKRNIEKALASKLSTILSNFQPEVEGKFCRVLADFSTEFGLTLLQDNEVCAPDLPVDQVVGIRSPKGGIKEQGIYNNISITEVVDRVNKSQLSYSKKKALSGLFKSLRKGSQVAIVPSSDEVKLLHSGMDFDFDGVTFITDKRIVNELKKHSPVIVKVTDEGDATSKERYQMDHNYMVTLMDKQFNNGNLSVGVVCNHNHSWVMLLSDLRMARAVLTNLNGAGSITSYKGLDYVKSTHNRVMVEINADKTQEILKELKTLDFDSLDDETIFRIIEDINVIMNRYIQVTIDASKSGQVLTIPEEFLINEVVLTASLMDVDFDLYRTNTLKNYTDIVKEKLSVKILNKSSTLYPVTVGRGSKKFIFNDAYHKIRTDVARVVARFLCELVNSDARLDEATSLMRDKVKYNKNEFIHFSHVFNDVNAAARELMYGKSDNERADINSDFRDTLTYLENSIKIATPYMTSEERVLAAIDVATDKRSDINAAANMFPSATLPWEYVTLCSKHAKGIDFVGEPINNVEDLVDGERARVISNTIVGQGFVDVEDGVYTMREYNGKFYAAKNIEELVKPLIESNKKVLIRMSSGQKYNEIAEAIKGKPVEITSYKNSPTNKDSINGVHRIDLPMGYSTYAKAIDKTRSNIDKQVLSTTITNRGLKTRQMFLCLELLDFVPSNKEQITSVKTPKLKKKSSLTLKSESTFKAETHTDNFTKAKTNSKLAMVKKARSVYEALTENEKVSFPADKLAKLERLEKELGINNQKIEQAIDIFDLI